MEVLAYKLQASLYSTGMTSHHWRLFLSVLIYRHRRRLDRRDFEENASWLQPQVHQPVYYRSITHTEISMLRCTGLEADPHLGLT